MPTIKMTKDGYPVTVDLDTGVEIDPDELGDDD